ncbi:nuclear transport factor 2 family protein [Microtetraspora malaysiensis]|uniref:nuclear transport factor 2 family protein n=1 Tax=Microtetraspora malaysiensis TaxID=161358 RepID=UPI003D89C15E
MTLPLQAPQSAELYLAVQHFYARQMQLLDDGRADEWAATFTEDAVFAANARPEPVRGRADIAAGAREAVEQLAQDGLVRRHWLGMLSVDARADGTVLARSYALVISTPRGGQAGVHVSTVCVDVLVWDDEDLLVRDRHVTRDDLV